MESASRAKPCGGLEGTTVRVRPVDPMKTVIDACHRMGAAREIDVEPAPHPTVPGLVVLRPVPKKPPEDPEAQVDPPRPQAAGPDHAARLALIERIDRLLSFENRIAELEAQNHALEDIVARLAGENKDLKKSQEARPANP